MSDSSRPQGPSQNQQQRPSRRNNSVSPVRDPSANNNSNTNTRNSRNIVSCRQRFPSVPPSPSVSRRSHPRTSSTSGRSAAPPPVCISCVTTRPFRLTFTNRSPVITMNGEWMGNGNGNGYTPNSNGGYQHPGITPYNSQQDLRTPNGFGHGNGNRNGNGGLCHGGMGNGGLCNGGMNNGGLLHNSRASPPSSPLGLDQTGAGHSYHDYQYQQPQHHHNQLYGMNYHPPSNNGNGSRPQVQQTPVNNYYGTSYNFVFLSSGVYDINFRPPGNGGNGGGGAAGAALPEPYVEVDTLSGNVGGNQGPTLSQTK